MAACRAYKRDIQSLNQRSYHDIYLESIVTRLRSSGERGGKKGNLSMAGRQILLLQKREGKRKRKNASSVRISGQQPAGFQESGAGKPSPETKPACMRLSRKGQPKIEPGHRETETGR